MPSSSEKQAKAARMALAAARGEISFKKLKGAAKQMWKDMNQKQLEEFSKVKK